MPNKEKKGLSQLMRSRRFKKFANQEYDLLADGNDLVIRSKAKNEEGKSSKRQGATGSKQLKNEELAEVGTKSVPTSANLNPPPPEKKIKNNLALKTASKVGTKSVPTTRSRPTLKVGTDLVPTLHKKTHYKVNDKSDKSEKQVGTESVPTSNEVTVVVPAYFFQYLPLMDLSVREAKILFAITYSCLCSPTGSAEISGNELTTRTNIHRSHIFQSIKTMIEKGFIIRENQDFSGKNLYRINFEFFKTSSMELP